MKSFVVLCALVVVSQAAPGGYAYSAYAPYPYAQPISYFYTPRAVSGFSYSVTEGAPLGSYAAPALDYAYPAPAVSYVQASPVPAPVVPVAAPAAPVVTPVVAPVPAIKSQYYSQDSLGQARYGHDEPGQSHHAIQDAAGNKFGSFSYIKPDGKVSITQYTADQEGYRVASNDLPVGPGSPAPAEPSVPVVPVVSAEPFPVAPVIAAADAPAVPVIPVVPSADAPSAPQVSVVSADAPSLPALPVESADAPSAPIVPAPSADASAAANADSSDADSGDDTIQVENVERSERSIRSRRSAVLPSGYLADTPEVATAKAAHFAEHAKASSAATYPYYSPVSYYPYAYAGYPYAAYPYATYPYAAYPYSYAASSTVVTPDGYLVDTPEVSAAKAAHFAEHAVARSRVRRDTVKRSPDHLPASTSPLVPAPAPVPIIPVVPAPAAYAPTFNTVAYTRPVDPAVPVVPLAPIPVSTVIKTPAQAYAYPVYTKK